MRTSSIQRNTKETQIELTLNLDGEGRSNVQTGVGFFDHMLDLFCFHSGFDLTLKADGDLHVCDHHLVEDVGIALGSAIKQALGDKKGIARYGSMRMVMDETLCLVDLDISGRPYLVCNAEFKRDQIGSFSTEMVEEFLRALSVQAGITLHVNIAYGTNDHHKVEAIFKALARALKQAVKIEGTKVPSSKGWIES